MNMKSPATRSKLNVFLVLGCLVLLVLPSVIGAFQSSLAPADILSEPTSSDYQAKDITAIPGIPSTYASAEPTPSFTNYNSPIPSIPLGNLLLIYGESQEQDPTEGWEDLFNELGYSTITSNITDFTVTQGIDVVVVLPNTGEYGPNFVASPSQSQAIVDGGKPVLLLGYAHEVLDQVWGFDSVNDFYPCGESALWTTVPSHQVFTSPHVIPGSSGQMSVFEGHVDYDAYRISALPEQCSILAHNYPNTGAHLIWFHALVDNPQIYYWGVDTASRLDGNGRKLMDNLLHWLLRTNLGSRLGPTLASLQLPLPAEGGYWGVQGAGGFAYPLEPSIAFTYYVADMVVTLGLDVNISAFSPWLLDECYDVLGYFEDLASLQRNDRCVTTSMAVLSLAAMAQLGSIDVTAIGDYIAGCQDLGSGGFFTEQGVTTTTIQATRYAVEALVALGQLGKIDVEAAIDFIAACQELDPSHTEFGGFYDSPGVGFMADLPCSLDALEALSILGAIYTINQPALLTFIQNCENPMGSDVFDTRIIFDNDELVLGTSCALRLLQILGSLTSYNTTASRVYLLTQQYPNGGWGRGDTTQDFHNSPDETWYGVQGLIVTGGLGGVTANLVNYLSNCTTGWGGATEPKFFGDLLTAWQIISALYQAGGLSAINRTSFLSYLDNCWLYVRSSLCWHQQPPDVVRNSDAYTPDRSGVESNTFGPLYHYAFSELVYILDLEDDPLWSTRLEIVRNEIVSSQTLAEDYRGMFGLHHLYVGRESDLTFRFEGTCWNLIAHEKLGGQPADLLNSTAALLYLQSCLQESSGTQYFQDIVHTVPLPAPLRAADDHLAETWLGLKAYSYLDPTCAGLDGIKLAVYASSFLDSPSSIITTFYATDILYLLTKLGLYPSALDLIDKDSIVTLLEDCMDYNGLFQDSSQPEGRWMPYVTDLALRMAVHLNLLIELDGNPTLSLTPILYPTGVLYGDDQVEISVTVNETKWGLIPESFTISALIFGEAYTPFTGTSPLGQWNITFTVPFSGAAIGPQDLTLIVRSPTYLPGIEVLVDTCEVWGSLTATASYSPGLTVPRSVPLEVTVHASVIGASGPEGSFPLATVELTNENNSLTYPTIHQGGGYYIGQVLTEGLNPGSYQIRVNVSSPYCIGYQIIEDVDVVTFSSALDMVAAKPTLPIVLEPTTIDIRLEDENATGLAGFPVEVNITSPSSLEPVITLNCITNTSGLISCTWTPDEAGQWILEYYFAGQNQYESCNDLSIVTISRRPLTCSLEWISSAEAFVGNESEIKVTISDTYNGSLLSELLVSFFEGEDLLYSAYTDANGEANYSWSTTAPLGYRYFHVKVAETSVYEESISTDSILLVKEVTTTTITQCTTTIYLGESMNIALVITAGDITSVNGTASLYWDGVWELDFPVLEGIGLVQIVISYTESPGEHLLAILFGQRDDPDIYTTSSDTVIVKTLRVYSSSVNLTISPTEVTNLIATPTISVEVLLSYENGSSSYGFSGQITFQLFSANGSLLLEMTSSTEASGLLNWAMTTPSPGYYNLVAQYSGDIGFAPSTDSSTFVVRGLDNPIGIPSPLLTLASLGLMIGGLCAGIFLFIRFQRTANEIAGSLVAGGGVTSSQQTPDSTLLDLVSERDEESATSSSDSEESSEEAE